MQSDMHSLRFDGVDVMGRVDQILIMMFLLSVPAEEGNTEETDYYFPNCMSNERLYLLIVSSLMSIKKSF